MNIKYLWINIVCGVFIFIIVGCDPIVSCSVQIKLPVSLKNEEKINDTLNEINGLVKKEAAKYNIFPISSTDISDSTYLYGAKDVPLSITVFFCKPLQEILINVEEMGRMKIRKETSNLCADLSEILKSKYREQEIRVAFMPHKCLCKDK